MKFSADEIATWTEEDWTTKPRGFCRITAKDGRTFAGWVLWLWGPPRDTGCISMNLSDRDDDDITGEVHVKFAAVKEIEVLDPSS